MERLTDKCWANNDPWEMCGLDKHCNKLCVQNGTCCKVSLQLRRLAMYEDIGLLPAEVTALQVENGRLQEVEKSYITLCEEKAKSDTSTIRTITTDNQEIDRLTAELSDMHGKLERKEMVALTYALGTPLFEEWPKGSGEIIPFFVLGQVDNSIITCNQGLKDVLIIGTDEVHLTEESARAALKGENTNENHEVQE